MTRRAKILVTNDDGIFAPGIRHLWHALHRFADLVVVAPLQEQSASGLSITIRMPLRIEAIDWPEQLRVWGVSGTPADCVKLGLHVVMKEMPDLVVSGINRGSNAGRNVLYSGTVAGAIEGVMHNIPSVAFSCIDFQEPDYAAAEAAVLKVVKFVLEHPLAAGTLLNVNFPSKVYHPIKGFKLVRQGRQFMMENPDRHQHPFEMHPYYWLGAKLSECCEEEDSDIAWLEKGYMTAVPLHIAELTDHEHLDGHRSLFEEKMNIYLS